MKKIILKSTACMLLFVGAASSTSAQLTTPAPYCDASFDDAAGPMGTMLVADAIWKVGIGTLLNTTNDQQAAPHYVYFNNLSAPNLTLGNNYPLHLTFDVHGACRYAVFIDFNHNNLFETSEKVASSGSFGSLGTVVVSPTVSIPATAVLGVTRMRVRFVEDDMTFGSPVLACNASTSPADVMDWGETEDYNVNIVVATGVKENDSDVVMDVYPNPATDKVSINFNKAMPVNSIFSILDVTGEVVKSGKLTVDFNQIELKELNSGVYFIQLQDNETGRTITKKFIKL